MKNKPKNLTLREIKNKLLAWTDIYGADIPFTDEIEQAKNKDELTDVIYHYGRMIQDTANDAERDCEEFGRSLGLHC